MLFQARDVILPVVFLMFQALNVNVPWARFIVSGSKRQLSIVFSNLFVCRFFNLSGSKHRFDLYVIVSGSKRQFKCVRFVITMNIDFIAIMVPVGPGR